MTKERFIAWHGSPCSFSRFDFSKLRDVLGVFFAAEKSQAGHYGLARPYCLTFKNLLCVRQGREYAKWLLKRNGEQTGRDVRRRLIRGGYDGVRIEYDGGAVDYVAFSNRSIKPIPGRDSGNAPLRVAN